MVLKLLELLNIQKIKIKTLIKILDAQRGYILLNGYEKFLETVYKQEKTLSTISELKLKSVTEMESLKLKLKAPKVKRLSELSPYLKLEDGRTLDKLIGEVKELWSEVQRRNSENRILITKTATILNKSLSTLKSYSGDHGGYTKDGNFMGATTPNRRVVDRTI